MDNNEELPDAVAEHDGLSAIWLVPFIALIFAGWLTYKAISERGVFVTIEFNNANGIVAGKTEVRYKGLTVGRVSSVDVSKDFQRVIVEVEMLPSSDPLLTDKTQFWYVTADISLDGISGLDTLLSGGYISILPDLELAGESQRYFVALQKPPTPKNNLPGLHVKLYTTELGSLGTNSPITFKQMPVGTVTRYQYDEEVKLIEVEAYIEPEHAHLVRTSSRFWISSGFNVTASLSAGFKLRTESIASLISGGIAFDNLEYEPEGPQGKDGDLYHLFRDFQAASMGHQIEMELPWDSGLDRSAAIIFQGITVGQLSDIKDIDPDKRKLIATADVDPRLVPYLTENTKFFVVSPKIDVSGLTNLNALLLGSYIGIRPSDIGESKDTFDVATAEPPMDTTAPGLHLTLNADNIGSLNKGTGVFNNDKRVGSIEDIQHLPMQKYRVQIHIEPEYQHFVNSSTQFWNASGIRVAGGIQNFEIQAQSLKTVLAGGIAFTTDNTESEPAESGDEFTLFKNREDAQHQTLFTLLASDVSSIKAGSTRVLYQGKQIGLVLAIHQDKEEAKLSIGLKPEFEWILKGDTEFWLVKPLVSLSGITDTDAIIGGAYISFNPGYETQNQSEFKLGYKPKKKSRSAPGLQLTLSASNVKGIKVGSQVSYKSLIVGHVDSINLSKDGKSVEFSLTIEPDYAHLISNNTRFYKANGFSVSASLSGIKFQSESVDAFLTGAVSFYNPEGENSGQAKEGQLFSFYPDLTRAQAAGQVISVSFNRTEAIKPGTVVVDGNNDVGSVVAANLIDNNGMLVKIELSPQHKDIATQGSEFWFSSPGIDVSNLSSISDIVSGGVIKVKKGEGKPQTNFIALNYSPVTTQLAHGKNLVLESNVLGSVSKGNPILYRQIKIGEVIGTDLSSNADKVLIYINIEDRYSNLVNASTKFWNASGIKVDAGLFSGFSIDTSSLATLLNGGIAMATQKSSTEQVLPERFVLHDESKEEWLEWQPKISLD